MVIKILKGTTISLAGHPVKLKKSLYITPGKPIEFHLDDHEVLPYSQDDDDGYPD